jgi:hypothetical protein
MATQKQLETKINDLKEGLESKYTPEENKAQLRELLKEAENELADLKKSPEPSKEKPKAKATEKKSEPTKKAETEGKKSAKSLLDNCRKLLAKHKKDKATASKRIEKRKKAGKPVELTPSEAVSKTAKAVTSKVISIKEKTDKGLSTGEVNKLSTGIVSTIKATLKGIEGTANKKEFLEDIIDEVNVLKGDLSKVARYGGRFAEGGSVDFTNDGAGMFRRGGWNKGRSWYQDRARYNKSEKWERPISERKNRG